jgi:hypothetical protein
MMMTSDGWTLKGFSRMRRHCNDASISMVPLSTKLQHELIDSLRSPLERLMLQTFRRSHMTESLWKIHF